MRILGLAVINMGIIEVLYVILKYLLRDGGAAQVSVIWHDWVRDQEVSPTLILLVYLSVAALLAALVALALTWWIDTTWSKFGIVVVVGLAAAVYGLAVIVSSPPIKLLLSAVVIGIGAGIRSRQPEDRRE